MAVQYPNPVKVARMHAVRDYIDGGSGPGVLEIGTAGMAAVLVSVTLNDPSGSAAGAGVLTLSGFPKSPTATGAGTAAAARIKDSAGNIAIQGLTVGTSAADVIVDNTNIAVGQTVEIDSAVFNHAA